MLVYIAIGLVGVGVNAFAAQKLHIKHLSLHDGAICTALKCSVLGKAKDYTVAQGGETTAGAWLPIAVTPTLDKKKPHQVEVMGERLVVWHQAAELQDPPGITGESVAAPAAAPGAWIVQPDYCPHRLAPLSQGRVDPDTNCLECPYHGWQFDGEGTCRTIPQLDRKFNGAIPADASTVSLPTKLVGEMLFAFLTFAGESEPLHFPQTPEETFPILRETSRITARELPYSFDFLIENFMDPAHIPFGTHPVNPHPQHPLFLPLSL
jgi:pheophorbide a oxygenase